METSSKDNPSGPDIAAAPPRKNTRRCIITKAALDKYSPAFRFVVDPAGKLIPDLQGKLPGRGAWLIADRKALKDAITRKAFPRALKQDVQVPAFEDLMPVLTGSLRTQCLNALGLLRRNGGVILGFEKVQAALKAHKIGTYICAHDGAADGRNRLSRYCEHVPVITHFSNAELSRALGVENAVHIGIPPKANATRLRYELARLDGILT